MYFADPEGEVSHSPKTDSLCAILVENDEKNLLWEIMIMKQEKIWEIVFDFRVFGQNVPNEA